MGWKELTELALIHMGFTKDKAAEFMRKYKEEFGDGKAKDKDKEKTKTTKTKMTMQKDKDGNHGMTKPPENTRREPERGRPAQVQADRTTHYIHNHRSST